MPLRQFLHKLTESNIDAFVHLIPFSHGLMLGVLVQLNSGYEFTNPGALAIYILSAFLTLFLYLYLFGGLLVLVGKLLGIQLNFVKLKIALSWVYLPFTVVSSIMFYLPIRFRASFESLMNSEMDVRDHIEAGGAVFTACVFMLLVSLAVSVVSNTVYKKGAVVSFIALTVFMLPLWLIPFSI